MLYKKVTLVILLLVSFSFLRGCQNILPQPIESSSFLLGTIVDIKIYDSVARSILDDAFNIIKDMENLLSKNIENSDISNINKNAGKQFVHVSPDTLEVIQKGIYYGNISGGLFDISIAPLVDLWNIDSDRPHIPSKKEITNILRLVNYKKIEIRNFSKEVYLNTQGMALDLGGIAKGYITDKLVDFFRSKGVKHAIINLGGNIFAIGTKPDGSSWRIGIQNPFEPRGTYLGIVSVNNLSVVTSGIYERYFESRGRRYHHILSPKTGYPFDNGLASVSIIAAKSVDADALSTTVFALGLKKGKKLIDSLDSIDAIFVTTKKQIIITDGIKNNFKLTQSDFTIKSEKEGAR